MMMIVHRMILIIMAGTYPLSGLPSPVGGVFAMFISKISFKVYKT